MNVTIPLLFSKVVAWLSAAVKNTLKCALFLTKETHYSTLCQYFIAFTRIKTNTEVFTLISTSRMYLTNKGHSPVKGVLVIK